MFRLARTLMACVASVFVFLPSAFSEETDPLASNSNIPTLTLLQENPPRLISIALESHAEPIRVEVREIVDNEANAATYLVRPEFYVDIDEFREEYELVCGGEIDTDEPVLFFLPVNFPNLVEHLAPLITAAAQDQGRTVDASNIQTIPNNGFVVRFTDRIASGKRITATDGTALTGPRLDSKDTIDTDQFSCSVWKRVQQYLERGAEPFEASILVWSSDTFDEGSATVKQTRDFTKQIEDKVFGNAESSIVYYEDRGGSQRTERSSTQDSRNSKSRSNRTHSIGGNIPLPSGLTIGAEVSSGGGGSTQENSFGQTEQRVDESVVNQTIRKAEGKRLVTRDYITDFLDSSISSFAARIENMTPEEASRTIEACIGQIEAGFDFKKAKLEIREGNKAQITIKELGQQIGLGNNVTANTLTELQAAGPLDLDVAILDREVFQTIDSCEIEYTTRVARPISPYILPYDARSVLDAWRNNERNTAVESTIEKLATNELELLKSKNASLREELQVLKTQLDLQQDKYREIESYFESHNSLLIQLESGLQNALELASIAHSNTESNKEHIEAIWLQQINANEMENENSNREAIFDMQKYLECMRTSEESPKGTNLTLDIIADLVLPTWKTVDELSSNYACALYAVQDGIPE